MLCFSMGTSLSQGPDEDCNRSPTVSGPSTRPVVRQLAAAFGETASCMLLKALLASRPDGTLWQELSR